MRFKGLDLNLLVALDALIELRNVSQAADRLRLSQPAVSAALARLREYFEDELFVMDGKRMHPTPFAERLIPQVKACLAAAETVVATTIDFTPAQASRTFRIITSDYVIATTLADVTRQLAQAAPGVRLEFVLPDDPALERFARGDLDLLIAPAQYLLDAHPHEVLYDETHVIAGDRDNPLFATTLTTEAILAAGHIAVSIGTHRTTTIGDRHMDQLFPDRRIEVVVSSFAAVPWLLVGTSRLALMHRRLAATMARQLPIAFAPLPFDFPTMHERVQYHRARAADEGLRWLISTIRTTAEATR